MGPNSAGCPSGQRQLCVAPSDEGGEEEGLGTHIPGVTILLNLGKAKGEVARDWPGPGESLTMAVQQLFLTPAAAEVSDPRSPAWAGASGPLSFAWRWASHFA